MSNSRILRVLGDTQCILKGKTVHARIITSGSPTNVYTNNHILNMYIKFGLIHDAGKVFDQMSKRNLISWSALVSGYSHMGMPEEALTCLRSMVADGFEPNHYTYVGAISGCASLGNARKGKEVHGRIYRFEGELNSHVSNCLVNMYGKCGLLSCALSVFDGILEPNLVSWSSILSGYCQSGEYRNGLEIFVRSRKAGVEVNEFCCSSVLGASAGVGSLMVGMQVHCLVFKCGIELDRFVVTGLLNLYGKCGELDSAYRVFLEVDQPQLSAWTSLIGCHVQQGKGGEGILLFRKLLLSGMKPNERTLSSVLGAFSDKLDIKAGRQLHSLIIKMGFMSVTFVSNAILDLYSKCGVLEDCLEIFEEMDMHDVVSWNALISGLVRSGCDEDAVKLLEDMLSEGIEPNTFTYSNILTICSNIPAIEWGKQTHCRILKPDFESNVVVGSALIDMYAKCGRLQDSRKVFDSLSSKNLVSWNSMLVGYAQHGFGREALDMYDMMQKKGIMPSDVTFIGMLTACGHVGFVEEGWHFFNSMIKDYKITPKMDHLASIVDLFARNGQTQRAYEFIKSFSLETDKVVWRCLLSGCKISKDWDLGRYAAEKILQIDPEDASAHIMLSNIYADAKMWKEAAQVRKNMRTKALKKDKGYSWIELKNKIYSIPAGHFTYFQGINLRDLLNGLTEQLCDAGYVPDGIILTHYEESVGLLNN